MPVVSSVCESMECGRKSASADVDSNGGGSDASSGAEDEDGLCPGDTSVLSGKADGKVSS